MTRPCRPFLLLATALAAAAAPAQPAEPAPRTFLVAPARYVAARAAGRSGHPDPVTAAATAALRAEAARLLDAGPWSVTDKPAAQIGPRGDRHDFVSMSSYWWPGPDGAYVWRDGRVNPAMVFTDEAALGRMMQAVRILAIDGYVRGDDHSLARAAFLLRHWFLDPATRMNPNLDFAAGIPGQASGRGIGLHRFKDMPWLVDVIGLVATSPAWTDADAAGMQAWLRDYLHWALASPLGRDEKREPNNHAVFYGAQILAAALCVGDTAATDEYLHRYFQQTLIRQIAPDGALPQEMKRTRPYNYAVYTMTGFCYYAELARNQGVDLYHFAGPEGQSLARAFEWLIPFLAGRVTSPRPEEPMRLDRIFLDCRLAARRCALPFYEDYLRREFPRWREDHRNLLWPPADE